MFEARLSKCLLLKKVVDGIRDLIVEGNFDCSEEGVALQAMETSHVALVSLLIRADAFESYRCDRPVSLGIGIKPFSTILKCAGTDDSVTIKAQDEGADTAEFIFENESQDRISDFELKLMDIDAEHLGIPDEPYAATIKMPSSEFRRIVTDLGVIGDLCQIEVSKSGASFQVKGDIGKGNICLHSSVSADKPEESVVIEMTEPVKMSYALRYLSMFSKASPLSDTVTIQISNDVPIAIQYSLERDQGFLKFFLAPKVEEDATATATGDATGDTQ
uniref:DNA sliding clamp PCNA n=1 Tax=Compsopogon caeruleus TaxID=31354 RepID=A0A7S1XH84_9RHOD|mmetsp:Transcript_8164/g.16451  ORF Transcript_8164/g.16451 Transcript_8164/m.16451 type:complete len:275 (+) Transcript_8164:197-1021(+)